jgi:hypothetical protein
MLDRLQLGIHCTHATAWVKATQTARKQTTKLRANQLSRNQLKLKVIYRRFAPRDLGNMKKGRVSPINGRRALYLFVLERAICLFGG